MAKKPDAGSTKSISELRKEDLINRVYNYYIGQGLSPIAAAYMVGSLLQESNLDPTTHQKPTGPGRGLAQWTDDPEHASFKDLQEFAKDHGTTWENMSVQLMFTLQQRPTVTAQLKSAKTEAEAKAAATAFENFDASKAGQRWTIAGQIIQNVNDGNSPGNNLGGHVTNGPVGELIQDLEDHFNLQDVHGVIKQCRARQQAGDDVPPNVAPPDHEEIATGKLLKK
jgi:Phage tail lysozyme